MKLVMRLGEDCDVGSVFEAKSKFLHLKRMEGLDVEEEVVSGDDSGPTFLLDDRELGNPNVDELERMIEQAFDERATRIALDPRYMYMIEEERPVRGLGLYRNMLSAGYSGQYYTRSRPSVFLDHGHLGKVMLLSSINSAEQPELERLEPTNVPRIGIVMSEFIQNAKKGIIYCDALEFLIAQNSFKNILSLLQNLSDRISQSRSLVLVSADPKTLDEREFHLLQREFLQLNTNRLDQGAVETL